MADQFDELKSPESLREECRSLLAQLRATQRGCKNARVEELAELYYTFFIRKNGSGIDRQVTLSEEDISIYIDKRKEELA